MLGSVTERLAPDADFLMLNGTNVTEVVNVTARDSYRVQVAAATTVLGGLIQVRIYINDNGASDKICRFLYIYTSYDAKCFLNCNENVFF